MKYDGIECPVCGIAINENDDVVVCPECGTPHHRSCYISTGSCKNDSLHSTGFVFTNQNKENNEIPTEEKVSDDFDFLICPVCKHKNPPGSEACEFCGQKFTIFGFNVLEKQTELEREEREEAGSSDNKNGAYSDFTNINNPGINSIDGISTDDLSEYIRNNYRKYISKFRKISEKKPTWNWVAFLFSPYWFFYRKLIKPGIVFLTVFFCLSVLFTSPITKISDTYFNFLETVQSEEMTEQEVETAFNETLNELKNELPPVYVYLALILCVKILSALLADRLYKKQTYKNINIIRQTQLDEEAFHLMMFKVGGTSPVLVLISYVAEYAVSMLVNMIIT